MDLGIIGGADGPTAIFVTASPGGTAALAVLGAAVLGAAVWLTRRRRKK